MSLERLVAGVDSSLPAAHRRMSLQLLSGNFSLVSSGTPNGQEACGHKETGGIGSKFQGNLIASIGTHVDPPGS